MSKEPDRVVILSVVHDKQILKCGWFIIDSTGKTKINVTKINNETPSEKRVVPCCGRRWNLVTFSFSNCV